MGRVVNREDELARGDQKKLKLAVIVKIAKLMARLFLNHGFSDQNVGVWYIEMNKLVFHK